MYSLFYPNSVGSLAFCVSVFSHKLLWFFCANDTFEHRSTASTANMKWILIPFSNENPYLRYSSIEYWIKRKFSNNSANITVRFSYSHWTFFSYKIWKRKAIAYQFFGKGTNSSIASYFNSVTVSPSAPNEIPIPGRNSIPAFFRHNSFDQMNTGTASWMETLFGILFGALRLTVMFDLNAYKWHMIFFMKYNVYYAAHKHTFDVHLFCEFSPFFLKFLFLLKGIKNYNVKLKKKGIWSYAIKCQALHHHVQNE